MVKESVTLRARNAPMFGPRLSSGRCMMWTSDVRKTKQRIIAMMSVTAIFTIVHRRSSRCSRNGLEVSLSGRSRNLKTSRRAMGLNFAEGKDPAGQEAGADRQRIRVANFVLRDHAAQFVRAKSAAIEDRFRFVAAMTGGAFPHWLGKKKIPAFIRKPGRSKIIAQRSQISTFGELEPRFLAQLAKSHRRNLVFVRGLFI